MCHVPVRLSAGSEPGVDGAAGVRTVVWYWSWFEEGGTREWDGEEKKQA